MEVAAIDPIVLTVTGLERTVEFYCRALGMQKIEEGPVDRTGAGGPMRSFYIRDPDGNLIEIASYRG